MSHLLINRLDLRTIIELSYTIPKFFTRICNCIEVIRDNDDDDDDDDAAAAAAD